MSCYEFERGEITCTRHARLFCIPMYRCHCWSCMWLVMSVLVWRQHPYFALIPISCRSTEYFPIFDVHHWTFRDLSVLSMPPSLSFSRISAGNTTGSNRSLFTFNQCLLVFLPCASCHGGHWQKCTHCYVLAARNFRRCLLWLLLSILIYTVCNFLHRFFRKAKNSQKLVKK